MKDALDYHNERRRADLDRDEMIWDELKREADAYFLTHPEELKRVNATFKVWWSDFKRTSGIHDLSGQFCKGPDCCICGCRECLGNHR